MKIIVVGGGEIGSRLTKFLSDKKHDVILVERDDKLCQELADRLNIKVIHGDGTRSDVLEEAGIKKADVLVVATREDETNLLVCLVAKEVLKEGSKLRIISRASKDEYKKIFLKIGVDNIVSPETSTIEQLEDIIEPEISDLGKLYKSMLNLVEFEVGKKSEVIKKPVHRVEFPEESLVIAIKRKDQFIIPGENEKFEAGDKVIMIIKKTMQSRIEDIFKS